MPSPMWKDVERRLAKWIDGRRHPSAGVSHVDVESDIITIESKYRESASIPAWFRHMMEQVRDNKSRHPEKYAVAALTEHFGKGIPTNVYLIMQVDIKTDSFTQTLDRLLASKAELERLIAEMVTGDADSADEEEVA